MDNILQCIDQCDLVQIKQFVQNQSDVNQIIVFEENTNLNLLHVLCGYASDHRDKVLKFLLDLKSLKQPFEIDRRSGSGNDFWTAAHISACWGHHNTLHILLENGANPQLQDANGLNVWEVARAYDNFLCIAVLRQYTKNVSKKSEKDCIGIEVIEKEHQEVLPALKQNSAESLEESKYFSFESQKECSSFLSDNKKTVGDINKNNRNERSVRKNLLNQIQKLSVGPLTKDEQKQKKSKDESFCIGISENSQKLLVEKKNNYTIGINEIDGNNLNCLKKRSPTNLTENSLKLSTKLLPLQSQEQRKSLGSKNEPLQVLNENGSIHESLISEDANHCVKLYVDDQFGVSFLNDSHKSSFSHKEEKLLKQSTIKESVLNDNQKSIVDLIETKKSKSQQLKREELFETPKTKIPKKLNTQKTGTPKNGTSKIDTPNTPKFINEKYMNMHINELRAKLLEHGVSPGPITESTKKLYAKKLHMLLEKGTNSPSGDQVNQLPRVIHNNTKNSKNQIYSNELNMLINNQLNVDHARNLEQEFTAYFERTPGSKVYFTYLLLDPRITEDLANKVNSEWPNYSSDTLLQFIRAIFYIGKGQGNRPFMHLYEAALLDTGKTKSSNCSRKLQRILDIWAAGKGVISLHCFHSISSPEALTRECFMINAIGLKNLTNIQIGQNRVRDLLWTDHKKLLFGSYLLLKAFQILIVSGERQIRKADINK